MTDRRGRKTGPKPTFSHEDVVDAAVAEGLDSFTLVQVAVRLGVVTSALYRRFPSREALLGTCLDRAAASIAAPSGTETWQELCRLWAAESWEVCNRFPGLARATYNYAPAFTHLEDIGAKYADVLVRCGKTPGQILFALDFIGDTVFACYLGVEMMRSVGRDGRSGMEQVQAVIGPENPIRPDPSWSGRGFMDVKVDFIIRGLERDWPEAPGAVATGRAARLTVNSIDG